MAFSEIKYHRLVSDEFKGSHVQDQAQACQGIGDALVSGFTPCCYRFTGLDNKPTTVIALYGSNGVLFGAYEFTGRP
ncbi:hypothetical protein ACGF8D_10560 [Streptomyces massasporeus]|uniref:hypothetical protein n=1 Tax=Streptomyces massasporeus TaxID=67324 RepID=UPI00371AF4E9